MPTVFNHQMWNVDHDRYDISAGKSTAEHINSLSHEKDHVRPVIMPETAEEVSESDLDAEGRYIGKRAR